MTISGELWAEINTTRSEVTIGSGEDQITLDNGNGGNSPGANYVRIRGNALTVTVLDQELEGNFTFSSVEYADGSKVIQGSLSNGSLLLGDDDPTKPHVAVSNAAGKY